MYSTHTVTEKCVLVGWSQQPHRSRQPEVILVPGDVAQLRTQKVFNGTVYTLFWVGTTGVFSATRFVRDDGSVFRNYNSRAMHAEVELAMCAVI